MVFTIRADLPLGTYRGAASDGRGEPVPSVARLYSALLCAAGFGPRAVPTGGRLSPCEADEAALRWLEENPPDGVSLPAIQVNRGRAIAYRDDGTIKKSKSSMGTKKLAKVPDASVAVAGSFAWSWSQDPPPDVAAALASLCPDVPYIGTTESPVRLAVETGVAPAPSHVLDPAASLFAGEGLDVEVPIGGRLAELVQAHGGEAVVPSAARDKWSTDESSTSPVPPRVRVALARYVLRSPRPSDVPWPQVVVLPIDRVVPEQLRVRMAVAVHRVLIKMIGEGAPPLVTGVYPQGSRPANRLAIQVLDQGMPVDLPSSARSALALLIPQGAEPGDLQVLLAAVENLKTFHGPNGVVYSVLGQAEVRSGACFWRESPLGDVARTWRTSPPAIPEVRGLKDGPWTFAHAALLSLGFVWKGQLPPTVGRGDERYRAIVDATNGAGVAVVRADPLRTSDIRAYFHRVNEHAVVRPYRAELWLGDLCGPRTIQAIGQTRHLGGGLLVPVDDAQDSAVNR